MAALGLAIEVTHRRDELIPQAYPFIQEQLAYLLTSRPTAVNLADASRKLLEACAPYQDHGPQVLDVYLETAEAMLEADLQDNRAIGRHGADYLLSLQATTTTSSSSQGLTLLTHCNTGSLATAGYGTALGVIRALKEDGKIQEIYHTETRPYLQGARLTAYELQYEGIPAKMIPDSAASLLLSPYSSITHRVDGVVVGADRVTANGDTANKVGTLSLALAAHQYGVPFLVCAPSTSVDLSLPDGSGIVIEERPSKELTQVQGQALPAPEGSSSSSLHSVLVTDPHIQVWNPGFDITPANLITAIITEKGVALPGKDGQFDLVSFLSPTLSS